VGASNFDRGWLPRTALEPCVLWLRKEAHEIARRDPPLVSDELYLNDHGILHIEAVLGFSAQLARILPTGFIASFSDEERSTLYAATLAHDLGLYRPPQGISALETRRRHAELSAEWVREHIGQGGLGEEFGRVLAMVVGAHSRSVALDNVELYTPIPESPQLVRSRLIAAMLRIADSLDIGQGRTPLAVYRHFEEQIPAGSAEHWAAHTLVVRCELDLAHREVVLHLAHDADPTDQLIWEIYRALQTEFDLIGEQFWDSNGCLRLHITFAQGGRRIAPGRVYGERLGVARR
jgi:hypothetical protein